jgi:hypothetical protein
MISGIEGRAILSAAGGKKVAAGQARRLQPLKLPIASCSVSYVSKTVNSFVMASRS